MFIQMFASGTNVQRLAKCAKHIDGVIYSAYAELEKTEPNIVRRKFFCLEVDGLARSVENFDPTVQPSWLKIWGKPLGNLAFITKLFQRLVGEDTLHRELNLSFLADTPVYCFQVLVSANNKEMRQIQKIAADAIPEYHIIALNGDFTTNKQAEDRIIREINESKIAGKRGIVIISNMMGSRSVSIPEIQSTVIAFDRGSVDATQQKISRCLTPTKKDHKLYDGSDKTFGVIVDLSFDPNRAENIEKIIIDEAVQVQRAGNAPDFTSAVRYVLSSIDLSKINEYGIPVPVTEEYMFKLFSDNEVMLKVADVSVDVEAALQSDIFKMLLSVEVGPKASKNKKAVIGKDAINAMKVGGKPVSKTKKDAAIRTAEKVINEAIHALHTSATSVYYLAGDGESYRDCIDTISSKKRLDEEFTDLFGIRAKDVTKLLDERVLNEAVLDVIVQNSKPKEAEYLF